MKNFGKKMAMFSNNIIFTILPYHPKTLKLDALLDYKSSFTQ